jgi:hypothetical protein
MVISFSLNNKQAFAQGGIVPPEPLIPQGLINMGEKPSADIFNLPPGYKIEPILWNLTLPNTVTFDDNAVCILLNQVIPMVDLILSQES